MGIMAINRIIVLSALFVQTLSAPSGCIESCNIYHTSYQNRHTSSQDHAGLIHGSTNLNDYNFARPGNWTEHNQYSTDGGHGKVHEERGQYVEGAKKIRYYKKNFTSSYGNVNGLDTREFDESSGHHRYDSIRIPSNQHFDSQSIQSGQTVQGSGYNRVHSQQSSLTRIDSRSEKLEDFGEYGHSQVNQRIPTVDTQTIETQHHIENHPSNWSRVDSYRTDGGHGRVFEEEGQYVTGPKKVRYYKKNYTSSYSTSDIPQTNIGLAAQELHSEMQRNLHKELDNIRREFHQTSNVGHTASTTHVGSMGLAQETVSLSDLQTAESNHRQQSGYGYVPSTGSIHHYTDQQHRETITDSRQPHTYPSTYGSESQRTYESRETYTSRMHPSHQSGHLSSGYIQIPDTHSSTHDNYQTSRHNTHSRGSSRVVDESQRTEVTHQSSVAQNQLLTGSSQHAYNSNPSYGAYPSRHGETRHYQEHWSTSSHTGRNLTPESIGHFTHGTADRAHYDRVAYNEHRDRYHGSHQGYNTHAHTSESSYNSAYRTNTGQLVSGLNVGHSAKGTDCTEETQHYQQETRYHRKYKRDDHHGRYNTQQSQVFNQELQQAGDQQVEDLTQQSEQHTQQIEGQFEFGQQTIGNQHLEDLTQQSEQFTQQTQGSDDFTQHMNGKLEFGQQTVNRQHVNNQHLQDFTQQNEQHTQQTEDQFEFGQQSVGNQHLEDLTQQSEQFTHQTEGQLEFGQHTVNNQYLTQQKNEQFMQQAQGSDNFMQQTNGKLEFQQMQSIDKSTKPRNQHFEEFGQYNKHFTQQVGKFDEFTQETMGQLEFGQKSQEFTKPKIDNQHLEDFTQQNKDLSQQIGELKQWQLEQKTNLNQNFTQETNNESTIDTIKPAPKPRSRLRHQKHNSISQYIDRTHTNLEVSKVTKINSDEDNYREETIRHISEYPNTRDRLETLNLQNQRSSIFDNEKENMDRLHWVHKSNDATVGLQWHYTYHPSDLTNIEGAHDNYYSHRNINLQQTEDLQQQSKPFDFNQQETQDQRNSYYPHHNTNLQQTEDLQQQTRPFNQQETQDQHNSYYPHHNTNSQQMENMQQQSKPFDFSQQETQDLHKDVQLNSHDHQLSQHNEYNQQSGFFQQIETSRNNFNNQHNQNTEETPLDVIPLQHSQSTQQTPELAKQSESTEETEYKLEPRILQAYGGGPYDGSRNEDMYSKITPNPSATLPPINSEDSWDIREKPIHRHMMSEVVNTRSPKAIDVTTTEMIETTQMIQTTTNQEAPPSFWNKLGHKITSTYDKAKEKAKEIFG